MSGKAVIFKPSIQSFRKYKLHEERNHLCLVHHCVPSTCHSDWRTVDAQ